MTSTTPTLRAAQADARRRSWRTLLQGLALDVAIAIAVALLAWLPAADLTTSEAWTVLAIAVAKSVLTAAASYIARLAVPPTTADAGLVDVDEQTAGDTVPLTSYEPGDVDERGPPPH